MRPLGITDRYSLQLRNLYRPLAFLRILTFSWSLQRRQLGALAQLTRVPLANGSHQLVVLWYNTGKKIKSMSVPPVPPVRSNKRLKEDP